MLSVPNVSEGRDATLIERFEKTIAQMGARVLDTHSDDIHHRSVFTCVGDADTLIGAMTQLARAAVENIDLTRHSGIHPRLGALDVCPFVPLDGELDHAVVTAHNAGAAINAATGVPIYFYAAAATRSDAVELRDLRRGGLEELLRRARDDLPPDIGVDIDPRRGVICVGARTALIAFNVWMEGSLQTARAIAAEVREQLGSLGVRALGLEIDDRRSQISTNLMSPERAGIDETFRVVEEAATRAGLRISATEVIGLPPERFLPDPKGKAARLLIEPGRSLESAIAG